MIRRGRLALLLLVLLAAAGTWTGYRLYAASQPLSVRAVTYACTAHPTSELTAWVHGYLVLPIGMPPLPGDWTTRTWGSLWNSKRDAYSRAPGPALRLIALRTHPSSVRLPGRLLHGETLNLHGQVVCGAPGPSMVVDAASR